jgi:hypothetical protein
VQETQADIDEFLRIVIITGGLEVNFAEFFCSFPGYWHSTRMRMRTVLIAGESLRRGKAATCRQG